MTHTTSSTPAFSVRKDRAGHWACTCKAPIAADVQCHVRRHLRAGWRPVVNETALTSFNVALAAAGHPVELRVSQAKAREYEERYPHLGVSWVPRAEADADDTWKVRVLIGRH